MEHLLFSPQLLQAVVVVVVDLQVDLVVVGIMVVQVVQEIWVGTLQ
jgi:hypothetical protein